MVDIPNPWKELLEIEEMHKKVIDLMMYVLKECGGLVWPLLYAFLLYWGWDALNILGKTLFILIGCILTSIGLLYPYVWRLYYKRMSTDFEAMIQKKSESLFEAIHNKSTIGYGEYEKDVQELRNSLSNFRRRYFPFN